MTFTKEQLIEQAKKNIEVLRGAVEKIPGASDAAVIHLKLAEITLAALTAEPVYQACKEAGVWVDIDAQDVDSLRFNGEQIRKLYTAPPAPVAAPDFGALTKCIVQRLVDYGTTDDEAIASAEEFVYNACRAAMLQGAEPVTKECKLPDDFDFNRFNDLVWLEAVASNPHMHSPTTSTIAMVALELNRKLAAGKSPAIPDGWVACSERMPAIGVPVITCCGDVVQYAAYAWDGKEWQDWYEEYDKLPASTFTHWHPRPAAPQQEVK